MSETQRTKSRQFGNILSKGGALFEIRLWGDLVVAQIEAAKAALILRGVAITPEIENLISQRAEAEVNRMAQEFASEGVPRVFTDLFALKKKGRS